MYLGQLSNAKVVQASGLQHDVKKNPQNKKQKQKQTITVTAYLHARGISLKDEATCRSTSLLQMLRHNMRWNLYC